MKDGKILPFANEAKKIKNDFKKMIDEMDDEAFFDMIFFLMNSEFEEDFDDDFDDEFDEFENPFSGEMINCRCPDCKKISAYPIEVMNEIYEETKKEPRVECYHCSSTNASPIYYKAPNGKIFKN